MEFYVENNLGTRLCVSTVQEQPAQESFTKLRNFDSVERASLVLMSRELSTGSFKPVTRDSGGN